MSRIYKKSTNVFLYVVVTMWAFVISLTALNGLGFVPYYIDGTPGNQAIAEAEETKKMEQDRARALAEAEQYKKNEAPRYPSKIIIPGIGVDLPISNPATTDVKQLDRALLSAVVRYPGSGALNKDGNMLIFGHSTGYRTVHNQMFKAFNKLKTLSRGDVITLLDEQGKIEYVYTVSNLKHEDASKVTVDFITDPGMRRLTLSTCDSFGKKSDRYIVTADFLGKYSKEQEDAFINELD
jgi:LPXTG-site transpeptidase (sortase) family protein